MISSQLAFSKSEINRIWSKFFQFLLNIFDLDFGEFAKKSLIIANWGRWSETVGVKLPGIMWVESYITENVIYKSWRRIGNSYW